MTMTVTMAQKEEQMHRQQALSHRTGVLLLLAETVMLFAAFTSALVVRKGASNDWIQTRLPSVLYWSNGLLLAGSVSLEFLRRQLSIVADEFEISNLRRFCAGGMFVAIFCGVAFLFCQWLAFRELAVRGIHMASNPSSSFLWVFIIAHAVHLFGGILGLVYVAIRTTQRLKATQEWTRSATAAAVLYWHFMTILWIYILALFTFQR